MSDEKRAVVILKLGLSAVCVQIPNTESVGVCGGTDVGFGVAVRKYDGTSASFPAQDEAAALSAVEKYYAAAGVFYKTKTVRVPRVKEIGENGEKKARGKKKAAEGVENGDHGEKKRKKVAETEEATDEEEKPRKKLRAKKGEVDPPSSDEDEEEGGGEGGRAVATRTEI